MAIFLFTCKSPLEELESKTYVALMSRTSDDQELSKLFWKFKSDTLFIFSNAIFGADNDTLLLTDFDKKDSLLTLQNLKETPKEWKLKLEVLKEENMVYLVGKNFYIGGIPSDLDIFSPQRNLSFYRNKVVSDNPDHYLFGAYEGEVEFESALVDMYSMGYFGGVGLKLVFQDDGQTVKRFMKTALTFTQSGVETFPYKVVGNKLIIGDGKAPGDNFKIVNNGTKLVCQTDGANIVLVKRY